MTKNESKNVQLVRNGMDAILSTKNEAVVEASFAENFIQHNPWAHDGLAHVKEMLQFDFGYVAAHWVVENDIVAYFGYYTAPNPLGEHPLLCTDVWRIENGKIQEHWDALAPMPEAHVQNAIGGTSDGLGNADAANRNANKASVKRFLDHVFNRGRVEEIEALVNENFVHHHETDGELKGHEVLHNFIEKAGGKMLHDNKMLLASGNVVMAHSHFFGENERVVFDWFLMDENNRILEHRNVAQPITPWEQVANPHPHF